MSAVVELMAQRLFQAYNDAGPNPWRTFDDRPMPPWEAMGDEVRNKWRAVAKVAIGRMAQVLRVIAEGAGE